MYHYGHYRNMDVERLVTLIESFPLALVVSCTRGEFLASHLPLVIERCGKGDLTLIGHLDAANPQMEALHGERAYVVFSGPNRYISPKVYTTRQLPTWNYLTVHGCGYCTIEAPGNGILDDIERLARKVEGVDPRSVFDKTNARVLRLVPLIRRLRITLEHIEGRFKLSQDKSAPDRRAAADHLLALDFESLRPFVVSLLEDVEVRDAKS